MVFAAMSALPVTDYVPGQPGDRFDPYVRLIRSLLPRTTCVAMFGPAAELIWTTDAVTGPDLMNFVDDEQQLLALLTVVSRANDAQDRRGNDFSFVCQLLAPAVECLRRELMAHATIEELNHTVGGLDKDLNLLLTQDSAGLPAAEAGAGDLQQLLQQTIEHMRA